MAIHVNYAILSIGAKETVDECFQGIYDHLSAFGYKPAGDDRAERLVEAIATYILESNK